MNTMSQTTIIKAVGSQRKALIQLLQAESLPVDDLPASLDHFFVAQDKDQVIGAIGLELYGGCGLLRSMVVQPAYRSQHIAACLVQQLEQYAKNLGIDVMYLLTETAPGYFERKGYQRIARDEVPEQLRASSEFSHVCPVSTIVMKKQIG